MFIVKLFCVNLNLLYAFLLSVIVFCTQFVIHTGFLFSTLPGLCGIHLFALGEMILKLTVHSVSAWNAEKMISIDQIY